MGRINEFVVLDISEVRLALQNYAIAEVMDLQLCTGGIINTNYVVRTRLGNYLLRVYHEGRGSDGIEFEVSTLLHLSDRGFLVQKPVRDRAGALINHVAQRQFVLLSFIEGTVLSREAINADICQQIGVAVAEMQNLLEGFVPAGSKPDADYPLIRELAELNLERLDKLGLKAAPTLRALRADWQELAPRFRDCRFPKGVVHADIYYQNVIVRGGALAGIIDFDDAYFGVLLFDLALIVMEFAIKEEGAMDSTLAECVLREYLRRRPLPLEQLESLYDSMRFLCFKFLGYTAELPEFQGEALLENGYVKRLEMFRQDHVRRDFESLLARLAP